MVSHEALIALGGMAETRRCCSTQKAAPQPTNQAAVAGAQHRRGCSRSWDKSPPGLWLGIAANDIAKLTATSDPDSMLKYFGLFFSFHGIPKQVQVPRLTWPVYPAVPPCFMDNLATSPLLANLWTETHHGGCCAKMPRELMPCQSLPAVDLEKCGPVPQHVMAGDGILEPVLHTLRSILEV